MSQVCSCVFIGKEEKSVHRISSAGQNSVAEERTRVCMCVFAPWNRTLKIP